MAIAETIEAKRRRKAPFTAIFVATTRKPGRYGDGGCKGLWLQVSPEGTKSWLLRYMLRGRARAMGLGPVELVSLAEARERARAARRLLLDGRDPIEARRVLQDAQRVEAARGVTFRDCAERYLAAHEASWRNQKHRAQWRSTLSSYAYPLIGDLPVSTIDTALVLCVLEPIWSKRPETAGRVRGRIEAVLDWATARSYRAGDNPARWRGHLAKLLPARSKIRPVRHHPALPYRDIPAFMAELGERDGLSARALELTILTGLRTSECVEGLWLEIDVVERLWRIPSERMKSGKSHTVPLAARAIAILSGLPRILGSEYLFPGSQGGSLSNMAMLEMLRGLRPGLTVHGFRSTLRDWAAEQTHHPAWVPEAPLAHVVANKVEAAYRRGELIEKRRALMDDWASYCSGAVAETKNA